MSKKSKSPSVKCYLAIPPSDNFRPILDILKNSLKETGDQAIYISKNDGRPTSISETIFTQLTRADLIIADITESNPSIFYEVGLGHALGKPVIFLNQFQKEVVLPLNLQNYLCIPYTTTLEGLHGLQNTIKNLIRDYKLNPRRFRPFSPYSTRVAQQPYIIDLYKLEPSEFENLCFELLTQMGFRRIEWGKEFREIDLAATLPKKDPDGYEYQEVWLISTGLRTPSENLLEIALREPEYLFSRILRSSEGLEELFSRQKIRYDVPITILLIMKEDLAQQEYIERGYRINSMGKRPSSLISRLRIWGPSLLTNLINQYPQIAYKYFSDEGRAKSKYRKTPDELYGENISLTENVIAIKNQLEEEKKKRFVAERNAAWKDVAFKAAHKLGNPIDAIDTYLQGLERRIKENHGTEALQIANEMEISVEEAKSVIAQFKSLIKAQEIVLRGIDIIPIIKQSCKFAQENGVKVSINAIEKCPLILGDPERIGETFDELVANSLHWFNKSEKTITVSVYKIMKKDIPDTLNRTHRYLGIKYGDNGSGVCLENKEKIFAPFFTTYTHGTGLGLSLVRWIIESHGGQISENGKPGKGASFNIILPVTGLNKRK